MRREFEDTIKHESTALEEHIAPVPAVILHDIVRLSLDPQIESNERDTADPPNSALGSLRKCLNRRRHYLMR